MSQKCNNFKENTDFLWFSGPLKIIRTSWRGFARKRNFSTGRSIPRSLSIMKILITKVERQVILILDLLLRISILQ